MDAEHRPIPVLGTHLVLLEIQNDDYGWTWLYLQDAATGVVYQLLIYSSLMPMMSTLPLVATP